MKKQFFDYMNIVMDINPDVYLIMCGLGWPRTEEFIQKFPDRAINVEASEQTGLDIAVGLAYSGKIPFVYTITPFFLRGFETIRTYIAHEKLNVKLVGAGRNDDYSKHDGFSHEAGDIPKILQLFPVINQYIPEDIQSLNKCIDAMVGYKGPDFISLKK